jgi:hypothetical protein
MNEAIIKYEGLPSDMAVGSDVVFHQLLRALRCSPDRWEELLRCANRLSSTESCYRTMEEKCRTLEGQCELLMKLVKHVCCSANVNFSKITIDEYSDDSQVNLEEIVTGLGDPYVDNFPVQNNKKIRLQHPERPGWTPTDIRIDLNLTGNATNYLDFTIQFFLGAGDKQLGKPIGPLYKGNQFLNKDGTQIRLPFPKYKAEPIDVGSLERLAVEITSKSAGANLESAQIVIPYDNNRFYKMCESQICKPGCKPDCGSDCQ